MLPDPALSTWSALPVLPELVLAVPEMPVPELAVLVEPFALTLAATSP